jgi:hypothetical protein
MDDRRRQLTPGAIDDAIDRTVRAMTAGEPSDAFTTHALRRIERGRPPIHVRIIAAATVPRLALAGAAVLLIAFVIAGPRVVVPPVEQEAPRRVGGAPPREAPPVHVAPPAQDRPAPSVAAVARPRPPRPRGEWSGTPEQMTVIPPLEEPAPLDVGTIDASVIDMPAIRFTTLDVQEIAVEPLPRDVR